MVSALRLRNAFTTPQTSADVSNDTATASGVLAVLPDTAADALSSNENVAVASGQTLRVAETIPETSSHASNQAAKGIISKAKRPVPQPLDDAHRAKREAMAAFLNDQYDRHYDCDMPIAQILDHSLTVAEEP